MIIAGAGGAAHLPGMLAAVATLPVIGVPVPLHHLGGVDSLLSIVQMPAGVPVATVAIGAARNAALLAARILAIGDPAVDDALDVFLAARAAASRDRDPGGAMTGGPSRPRSAPLRRGGAAPSAASGRRVRRPQGCGP